MYGVKPYETFVETLLKLKPDAQKKAYDNSWQHLFTHFPTLCTKEFALLSGQHMQAAEAQLKQLRGEGKLQANLTKNGSLWKAVRP